MMMILLVVFVLLIYWWWKSCCKRSIPFVKEGFYPLIGHLFVLMNNRTNHLKKFSQIYGNVFQMKIFNQTIVFLLNPSDWSIINRNQSFEFLGDRFSREIFDMDHNFFGKSTEDIQLQKSFQQFLINSNQLNQINLRFVEYLIEFFKKEKENHQNQSIEMNLFEFSWNLLFYSITKTFYGQIHLKSIENPLRIFDLNIPYLFLLFPQWIYRIFFGKVLKCRNELNQYWIDHLHHENQSQFIENRIHFLLDHQEFFTKKDYSGENTFLLWSSLSNTIPTLFWSLCYLLNNQNLYQIIQKEINEIFSLDDNQMTTSKLRSCKRLDSLINEVLRLYSNPMIQRRATKDIQLNLHDGKEIFIEKGDIIAFYPWIAQNDDQYFPSANQFQFDRFTNQKMENILGYLPFGSGQSMCPGRLFAKNVIQISMIYFLKLIEINFDHSLTIPVVNKERQGIGISHPQNDITFSFKYK